MRIDDPIETERLLLRPYEPRDLDAVRDLLSREDVVRYLYQPVLGEVEAREMLERKIASRAIERSGDRFSLVIAERGGDAFVGDAMLALESEEHRLGEVGYLVHPDHQGRGYATEAAERLLGIGFNGLGMHRIIGRTEARNVASARVLEKLGMRLEAHLVENEWVKGEWQSELVYALLEQEWRSTTR
jgi:RimJ/RimL family protein N-acetyltransferase